jgi:DNA processing protein
MLRDQQYWEKESVSLLALSSIKGIGYWTLLKLSNKGNSFNQIIKVNSFEELDNLLKEAGCKSYKIPDNCPDWDEFQKIIWSAGNTLYKRLRDSGCRLIHFDEDLFPESLRCISDPPKWLFVQGDVSILNKSAITIVGTRNPSADGIFLTNIVCSFLPYLDAVTVSGLANGIDQIVHRMSIRFKIPTIAVLGNGIFLNYPNGSENLRDEICLNGGAVITEYLPDQVYSGENFVRRNRIQAGLGKILIPSEWRSQSGTAHTVRYASSANKSIFCLKMPDWQDTEHDELLLAKNLGGKSYTFPIESGSFLEDAYFKTHGKTKNMAYHDNDADQDRTINTNQGKEEFIIEQLSLLP